MSNQRLRPGIPLSALTGAVVSGTWVIRTNWLEVGDSMAKLPKLEQDIIDGLRNGRELCQWHPSRGGDILLHFGHGRAPNHVDPKAFESLKRKGIIYICRRTSQRTFYDLAMYNGC